MRGLSTGSLFAAMFCLGLAWSGPSSAALIWDFVIADDGGGLSGEGRIEFSTPNSSDQNAVTEKALLEAKIFGLPMMSVDLPSGGGATASWQIDDDWQLVFLVLEFGSENLAVDPAGGLVLNQLVLTTGSGATSALCTDETETRCDGLSSKSGFGTATFTAVHVPEPASLPLVLLALLALAALRLPRPGVGSTGRR